MIHRLLGPIFSEKKIKKQFLQDTQPAKHNANVCGQNYLHLKGNS